jgi:hypothetical protein
MATMARAIHCTLLETPAMSDAFHEPGHREFRDLVPWADPYIASLIEKLRRGDSDEDRSADPDDDGSARELHPQRGETHWSPRNWPRD